MGATRAQGYDSVDGNDRANRSIFAGEVAATLKACGRGNLESALRGVGQDALGQGRLMLGSRIWDMDADAGVTSPHVTAPSPTYCTDVLAALRYTRDQM